MDINKEVMNNKPSNEKPKLTLVFEDVILKQLNSLRFSLIKYGTKPVEGLTQHYIDTQRVLVFISSIAYAINSVVGDMINNSKPSVDDVLMRMNKILKMLSDPRCTRNICGDSTYINMLVGCAKNNKGKTTSYEGEFSKSCLWAFASTIRIFAAASALGANFPIGDLYLYDEEEAGIQEIALNAFGNFAFSVLELDYKCSEYNYGSYATGFANNGEPLYERPINNNEAIILNQPTTRNTIDRFFAPAQPRIRKPECYARIIATTRCTQDALSYFACDIRIGDNVLENDESVEIISSSDCPISVLPNASTLTKQYACSRNNKQGVLRALIARGECIPRSKAFNPAQVTRYTDEPVFFNVPRMVRGCSLFYNESQCLLYHTLNNKSVFGDVIDSVVGLRCFMRRGNAGSMGNGAAYARYLDGGAVQGDLVIALLRNSTNKNSFSFIQPSFHTRNGNDLALDSILGNFIFNSLLHIAFAYTEDGINVPHNPDDVIFYVAIRAMGIIGVFGDEMPYDYIISNIVESILDMLFGANGVSTPRGKYLVGECAWAIPSYDLLTNIKNSTKKESIYLNNAEDDILCKAPENINMNAFEHMQNIFVGPISQLILDTKQIL